MTKYFRVLISIAKFSIKDDLAYRWDFISKLISEMSWVFIYLAFFEILFGYVSSFGGWEKYEVILLYGTYRISQQLVYLLSASLYTFHRLIVTGEFDFLLTKPIDSQVYSSIRKFRSVSIISFLANILIVLFSIERLALKISPFNIFLYIILVFSSSIILYSFYIAAATLNFWFTRVNNMAFLLHEIEAIGRIPITSFNRGARLLFTFVVPLVFLATVPAGVLLGKKMGYLVPMSFFVAALVTYATRRFWNFAIKNYTSAGG